MTNPIGIFDSGLGGLTVLKKLAENFPHESFCYLGDIARLPYGNKSSFTIRKYGEQILEFLKKQNVKALIIACNSASSVFLKESSFQGIPLLNVIEPGAEAALREANDKKIGVVGTSATVNSHAYLKIIQEMDSSISVFEQACPLLVSLVEEGFIDDPITQSVLERYLKHIKAEQVKTLILGCTHYPVLKSDFIKVLGMNVKLIESGSVLTEKIHELAQNGRLNLVNVPNQREIRICITDVTDQFERLANGLMSPEKFSLEKVVL